MEPILVEVLRGGALESVHRVHAIAVRDGEVAEARGDPGFVCFLRSSAKPFQALPLARERVDLDDRDLAIACASHRAEPFHLEAVRDLLAKAPAGEDDLECGGGIRHNCSGKHAGMLALCRGRGWESAGYRLPRHPCQQAMREAVVEAVGREPLVTAIDGCGAVTFAYPLELMARAFARLESLSEGARLAAAMRRHPELVRGEGSPDTRLMQLRPEWFAKGGAEGLLCAGRAGEGVALRPKTARCVRSRWPSLRCWVSRGSRIPGSRTAAARSSGSSASGRELPSRALREPDTLVTEGSRRCERSVLTSA